MRSGTRRPAATALAAAVVSAGCLAAGCGASGGAGAAASGAAGILASHSASFSPDVTFSPDGRTGAGSATRSPAAGAQGAASPAQTAAADSAPPSSAAPRPTSAPPTSAPATSAAATSTPPTSSAATPASSAPSAQPSASSPAPAASTSPPAGVWLWVLAGAVALAGLIAWLIYASRRSARRREWRAQTVDAYAKGSALADAIRIAAWPETETATDGKARWADIQRRMDDLAQTLYGLRVTAPGAAERAQVEDVLAGLQALHSEMAAGHARNPAGPRGPRSREEARLAERLRFFGDRLRDLRDGNRPY